MRGKRQISLADEFQVLYGNTSPLMWGHESQFHRVAHSDFLLKSTVWKRVEEKQLPMEKTHQHFLSQVITVKIYSNKSF